MQTCFFRRLFGVIALLAALLAGPVAAQSLGTAQEYQVGYQRLQRYDVSRSFDVSRVDSLRFRPVQIDLFYPTHQAGAAGPLPYGYFLDAYGSRMNFKLPADSCYQIGVQLAEYIRAELSLRSVQELRALPTRSSLAAPMVAGPHPLVLYCPAYNGLSYENIVLLEQLASRGYLVAAVSSVGQYPGYMTMDPVDIGAQVADAQFARAYMQRAGCVAANQVAVLGYSWGGLAATLLAMQAPPVQAVISLDGNDRYAYGEEAADDAQFSAIRQAPYFAPHRLAAPYLYLSSGREQPEFPTDSVYALATNSSDACYVRLRQTHHADFSCLPGLAHRLDARRPSPTTYTLIERLVSSWLDAQLLHKLAFADTLRGLLHRYPTYLTLTKPTPALVPAGGLAAQVLLGKTTDTHGHPLPYVSIGLVGGNQGTVSQEDGTFALRLRNARATDTIRLSYVGYQSRSWQLAALAALAKQGALRLALREEKTALPEVVVRAIRPVRRIVGNTITSKAFNVGFGSVESGAQVGIPLHVGKRAVALERVAIHLSYNRYDSLLLRLNVYRLEKGVPTQSLLAAQVLVRWYNQTGAVAFDLARHPLPITGSVLIAVELVVGWGGPQKGLFLSAGFLNGPSYYRRTSEGAWRRARGIGVGIQATVLPETP